MKKKVIPCEMFILDEVTKFYLGPNPSNWNPTLAYPNRNPTPIILIYTFRKSENQK